MPQAAPPITSIITEIINNLIPCFLPSGVFDAIIVMSPAKNKTITATQYKSKSIIMSFFLTVRNFLSQFCNFIIPVKQIHSFKGNHFILLAHDVNTGFFHGSYIKIIGIHKVHNDNSE
jgi:hypothetical protein